MKYTLEVIITVLEILKEKSEGVGQVAMVYEDLEKGDNPPTAIYYNGMAEAFETCIKLLKGWAGEDKCD